MLQAYENAGSDTSAQWQFNLGMISGIPQFDDMRGGCLVDLNADDRPDFLAWAGLREPHLLQERGAGHDRGGTDLMGPSEGLVPIAGSTPK